VSVPSTLPHPVPEQLVELIAQRFRVLGEPMRIRVLDRLRGGELGVQELMEATGSSQQNLAKHLAVLQQAGIVARRRAGKRALYSIADESVLDLCERVCGGVARRLEELAGLLEQGR
jgi:DNA-binding transcriptional ArsR family regulator